MNREIKSLPMVALRGMTIMPEMVVHFDVSREKSIAAIQEAMAGDQKIFSCGTKINRNRRPYTGRCLRGGNCWNDQTDHRLPKHITFGYPRFRKTRNQNNFSDTPYLRAGVE